MLTLITGGIKSGKSLFAENLAAEKSQPVYYIATAVITDIEMQKRVEQHQERRPKSWQTIEEKLDLLSILPKLETDSTVLIDCLTTFLSNKLWNLQPELFEVNDDIDIKPALLEEMVITANKLAKNPQHFIVVTNEVGLGLIPPTKIGRIFCDLQGKVNQIFAKAANNVYLTVSGIPIKIK